MQIAFVAVFLRIINLNKTFSYFSYSSMMDETQIKNLLPDQVC